VAKGTGALVVAVRDGRLTRVETVDDRLREDVEEEPMRAGALLVELVHEPVQESRVRVAHRLDLGHRQLEPGQPPLEPDDVLARFGGLRGLRHAVAPRRSATNVSLWSRLGPSGS